MRCSSCRFENPAGTRFCIACGVPFAPRCPHCGVETPPQARFCGACGAPLSGPTPAPRPPQTDRPLDAPHNQPAQGGLPAAEPGAPEAERRQLTVLFCDLVDSTALSSQLDPEDYREVVRAYQATCAEVIQRCNGHIAQYLGDGLLVYFGYPQAHEDDAQRAVRAGLDLLEALGQLTARLERDRRLRLAVRLGIHTGLVVVGALGGGGREEQLALGETPNVAARLQGLAAPDTVVISAATQRLVQGLFTCQALGTPALKGLAQPLAVYRVLGASAAQSRFEVAVSTGLTPLVGREEELGLLQRRWEQAREGHGQVVLLGGEAGIGKSRLVQEMRERVERDGATPIAWRCAPSAQHSALYPVITYLQRVLHFHRDDTPEERLDRLEQALRATHLPLQEVVPLFATLLSVPLAERYAPLSWSTQKQKQQTQEALVGWLVAEAERQPVLLVWEDLHWADPSSLELLDRYIDQTPTARVLLLLTCRPEFHPPWPPWSHLTQLTLSRFARSQSAEMVVRVAGGKALPTDVMQQIVVKTDGVPLFVEELTKTVLESGLLQEHADRYELTGPLPPLAIPATLHDALMARLDRLAAVKVVAQLGATLGRTFSYELLQAVSHLDELELWRGLVQLVQAEVLYQRGALPHATYMFKHALIQEAAYQSLLRSTRQQYHQRTAQVLAERFPEVAETQPELLAQHYTEAGLAEQAVGYWLRAGERSSVRSAYVEAVAHLTKGLAVLQTLPDTPARAQRELGVQLTLGQALRVIKGYGASEVEQPFARARELCRQVGTPAQLHDALIGLHAFYQQRGELQTARELCEQCLILVQRQQDAAQLMRAHTNMGGILFDLGELVSARTHLEQALALTASQQDHALVLRNRQDSKVLCLARGSGILWMLGYPVQALTQSYEMLTYAQELSHAFSLSRALSFAAVLRQFRREADAVREWAEAAIALSTEQGFPEYLARGTILRGWALAMQGQRDAGIDQIQQGMATHRATGSKMFRPYHLALLAEAYRSAGQVDAGLGVLAEALCLVDDTEERWYQAELYRLKGELLLGLSAAPHAEAAACLQQALDIACYQQAKSLELRAAMSLSRLWQRQGKRAAARKLLAPIYGWFTEGFDTADLQDAKALLDELA